MPFTVNALVAAGCNRELATQHFEPMLTAMLTHGINTAPRARAFVAQALHECGCLRWMEEIWGPNQWQKGYEGRADLGNTKKGDGFRYRGRGPFMLTGRANYRGYGQRLQREYEDDPDLVAKPKDGWLVAARYWHDNGLNALADRGDARGITRRINGAATDGPPSHHTQRMILFGRLPADLAPVPPDPYRVLTAHEREVVEALDRKRRSAKRHGGWENIEPMHLEEAKRLKAQLVEMRKAIWRAAEAEENGWNVKRRRARYELLKEKTA